MKNILLFLICVTPLLFSLQSCENDCDGKGYLNLTNTSANTVQRIMIDGVNYGSLDPGESESISLPAGEHEFQQVGISGGAGCSPAKVIIIECETQGFSCSN